MEVCFYCEIALNRSRSIAFTLLLTFQLPFHLVYFRCCCFRCLDVANPPTVNLCYRYHRQAVTFIASCITFWSNFNIAETILIRLVCREGPKNNSFLLFEG